MADFEPGPGFKNIKGYRCGGGALEAIEPVGKDKSGHYVWRCLCHKCGRTKNVNYVQFMKGKTKDCGCTPAHGYDLAGIEKGAITVIEIAGRNSSGRRIWLVRCSMCRRKSTMTTRQLLRDNPRCPICGA